MSEIIIITYFYKENNDCFLWLSSDYYYHKENIKGYAYFEDKLVIYYEDQETSICNNSLINTDRLIKFNDSIPGSKCFEGSIKEYEPIKRICKIVNPDSLEIISTGGF